MSEYRKQEASKARKRLAWELLQDTRNPEYVALRYGYPVEDLRKALATIPEDTEGPHVRSSAARTCHDTIKRAAEAIPPGLFGKRAAPVPEREPGSDDDLGETPDDSAV